MLPNKLETEAVSARFTTTPKNLTVTQELSSSLSSASLSSSTTKYRNPEITDGTEPRRKVKKVRSVKLVRLPSLKIIKSQSKVQPVSLSSSSSDAESSHHSVPEGTSLSYMKTTSSSAKKEILQKSSKTLTKRSSFKPAKSLSRLSSTKFGRSLRKSSGGTEVKRKLKKSKSIRLVHRPATSDLEEVGSQANSQIYGSSFGSNDENRESSSGSKIKTVSSSNKSVKVMVRSSSLRPLRRLTKVASLRSRKPAGAGNKFAELLEHDFSIHKATCSSALKDSKFPDHLELQPGGSQSEGISKVKVCPYSYCSLHGHHHSDLPPVRKLISIKRNQLKNQKISYEKDSLDSSSLVQKDVEVPRETLREIIMNHHEEVTRAAKVVQEVSESLAACKGDSDFSTTETNYLENKAVEPLGASNNLISEGIITKRKEKGIAEDITIASADFEQDNVVYESPKKHVGLWNLIYQHMVSGLATEDNIQTAHGKGEEMNKRNIANTLPGIHNSELNQSISLEDHGGSSNILVYQHNAIKLVQEAFDKILSEIPDQSSDNQSIDGDTTSNKEVKENDCLKGAKSSISTVSHLEEHTIEQHEGQVGAKIDSDRSEVRAKSNVGEMSEERGHKNWSNVKRIIMLKRFVKALEKVKKIDPRRPRVLPVDPDPEREKVRLRSLTREDRKNSEDWMLDYALQKVIYTLAPAQKRKVALLVQAFESVIPEIGSPACSRVIYHSETVTDSCSSSPYQMASERVKETCFAVSHHETTYSKQNQGLIQSCAAEYRISKHWSESEEPSTERGCNQMELGSSDSDNTSDYLKERVASLNYDLKDYQDSLVGASLPYRAEPKLHDKPFSEETYILRDRGEEFLISRQHLEVSKNASSGPTSTVHDLYPEINHKRLDNFVQINPTSEISQEPKSLVSEGYEPLFTHNDLVSSVSNSERLESSNEATETETKLKGKFLRLFNSLEESQPKGTSDVVQENQLEKQKNTRLWYLIYKHMVSGSRPLLEEAYKEEKVDETNPSTPTDAHSHQGSTVTDKEAAIENEETKSHREELQQIEAIRLVEEAIDDIPLPEAQDELPDDRLVSGNMILENAHLEKEIGKSGELIIPTTNDFTKEITGGTNISNAGQAQEEAKSDPNVAQKLKPRMQKSWSNVKRLILLQRFMKAMEKVKKINPRQPRFLPLDPAGEAEKVNLRHLDIKDRKNSDEWMLDYALQRVVSKLTPERKRKVQLLVEAFETVTPANWR